MRFRALHADLGVEVLDYDLIHDASAASTAALKRALDEHHLLLFRAAPRLTPEQHLAVAARFGTVCDSGDPAELVNVLHNEEDHGARVLPFHADFTYTDTPVPFLSLHALELPAEGTATAFLSVVRAWDRLDPATQDTLSALTIRHQIVKDLPDGRTEFIADHPVRFVHPRTGRPILYALGHAKRIVELPAAVSERVMEDLRTQMYRPEATYVHHWGLNDLVIWDNLALLHARLKPAPLERGARAMQRVAIGAVGHREHTLIARRQMAERERIAEARRAPSTASRSPLPRERGRTYVVENACSPARGGLSRSD